jgi:hypothetical protein
MRYVLLPIRQVTTYIRALANCVHHGTTSRDINMCCNTPCAQKWIKSAVALESLINVTWITVFTQSATQIDQCPKTSPVSFNLNVVC